MGQSTKHDYPIIVIGAGAGGLVVAIGSAKAGRKVLLIERRNYGGDCTNFGCIPSKSLIASAHVAHAIRSSFGYGINTTINEFNCQKALERTRSIVKEIRGHEEPEALAKYGVDTITGIASFIDPHTLCVTLKDGVQRTVTGKNIVIATGSHPFIPPIEGLEDCSYCTNETIFDLKEIPKRLGVIGGGPIGCELSQAFQRLGAEVTLIHHGNHLLKREELEAQSVIEQAFCEEGIQIKLNMEPVKVLEKNGKCKLTISHKKTHEKETLEVDHLLVSTGRRSAIEALNLEAANVATYPKGIRVDDYGRTSQKHIWAVGDVTGRAIFTHVAENEARTVLKNLIVPSLFKSKLDLHQAIPRVTYTDPEIASVGLNEHHATKIYGRNKIAIYSVPFSEVDRAITTSRQEGFVKIITKKWSSQIIGATIVAPRAGEMLCQVTTAMHAKVPLRKLATLIHPYPTYNLAIRKAADRWLTETILPSLLKLIGRNSS